jgi:peptide/nickel transport system ATP-binding protein
VSVLRVIFPVAYPPATAERALEDVSFEVGRAARSRGGRIRLGKARWRCSDCSRRKRGSSPARAFKGQSLFDLPEPERRALRGNRMSIVFQDPFTSLNPAIAVGRQIAEPLVWHKSMPEAAAAAEVARLLVEVGIPNPTEVALAFPHQLSGGMKQRALIATALACAPELLVLDEPTTALDVTIEAQILDLLEKLRRDRGLSMLYITHNLGVVARICDDVCVLYAGRVVEQGATGRPAPAAPSLYQGLLASLPRVAQRRHRLGAIPGVSRTCGSRRPAAFPSALQLRAGSVQSEPQILADGVRCWRADGLAGERWRADETRRRRVRRRRKQALRWWT